MVRALKVFALDTECTGLDIRHGARPFFTSIYDGSECHYWHWWVNPDTREVCWVEEDLEEIQWYIDEADVLVLQNPKFDHCALWHLYQGDLRWDWSKVQDTLLAGHLLASNQPHTLDAMALMYLGVDIKPYDDHLKKITQTTRRFARTYYPDFRLASREEPDMPSAKETTWKYDTWVPGQLAELEGYDPDHDWFTALPRYGCADPEATYLLYHKQKQLIRKRGLTKIYEKRLKVLPLIAEIEEAGVTISETRLEELYKEYGKASNEANTTCVSIASKRGCELELPKSGTNKSLMNFLFGDEKGLKLPVLKKTKKGGKPSLDKDTLERYEEELQEGTDEHTFVSSLRGKRKRDTALTYMEGYRKFWIMNDVSEPDWYVLHPSLNPTGTHTLRWSSSNPNEQNISKQEGFNLRYCFGPGPGREWWSIDAKNIELRIPAYEAGEEEMIALFERPDEPPYFGSNHLLAFDVLHTDRLGLNRDDPEFLVKAKKQYASTWYQWTKNGNFAVQYGSVESSGTADRAYHVKGGFRLIKQRFKAIHGPGGLNERMIRQAEQFGFVETIPDVTVDPDHGYPLLCTRTSYGKILPTVPLNYHVQGTAMWWMMKAMLRVKKYLDELNVKVGSKGYYMIMQVHDELVFDFPRVPNRGNLPKIRKIARLMEQGGQDIGLPTPVSIEYHPNNWSEGVAV